MEAFGVAPEAFFGFGRVVCSKQCDSQNLSAEVVPMKRYVAITLLVLGIFVSSAFAAANRAEQPHSVTWRQLSRSEWMLEFTLPPMRLDSVELSGIQWADISVNTLGSLNQPGAPALPCVSVWLPAVVELADFELIEQQSHTLQSPPPLPAPQPLDRSVQSSLTYLPNEALYTQAEPFPGQLLEVTHTGSLGKTNLTQLRLAPLQYSPATGTLTVYDRLTFRVTLPRGQSLDDAANPSQYEPQLVNDLVHIQRPVTPPNEITSPRLWIVTTPEYVDALHDWQEFKRACGITSEVLIFSEIASNAATLKTYLQNRYNGAETPAEYLFIIGDHAAVPGFYGVGSSLTDHPYSCISNDDFLPDISVGRLPVQNVTQLSQWLSRALAYELDGQVPQAAEATVFSSSVALDPIHGQQVNSVFQSAGLSSTALQQPQSGALPLLLNSLNDQPLWTFYIGHGNAQGWSSVAPHFTENALPQIQTARPGIVVSVACATADFDETENCIAEDWTLGLLNGGALCYIGATESTAFFYSDTIGLATLEAVFDRDYSSIGKALDYGKLRCAEFFPQAPGGLTEETIQQFILFGDPSLRPFTTTPVSAQIEIPEVLPVGSTQIPITIRYNNRGVPNCEAVLTSPLTGPIITQTDADGFALLTLPVTTEQQWTVMLRGLNIRATSHTVSVVPVAGPLVQLQQIELDENIGDHDGRADRGESGTLRVLLRNAGTSASEPGTLRLECSSSSLNFSPALLAMPSLPPQTEDWLEATANYSISTTVSNGVTAVVQAWNGTGASAPFAGSNSITLQSPHIELEYQSLAELVGDGDQIPEAGEQHSLSLVISNRGGEPLRLPIADCNPDHQYLHIQNTRWQSDSIATNQVDTISYIFQCDAETPRGYAFEFNVALSGTNSPEQSFWGHYRIGQVPVLLYVLDSQPQQLPGIQGALQVLGIEFETVNQLPTDLSRYSSVWIFCGVHPNQEAISSQAAQRIADYLDDGGCCYWEGGDVWAFDYETALHPYFGIDGLSDGSGDAGPLEGVRGRFTEGMSFAYSGENSFIDRIRSIGSAVEILSNTRENARYALCVANASGNYKTIGSSIELGALQDGEAPSTRVHLVRKILEWFEIPVLHDLTPPSITHVPLGVWHNANRPIPIFADVQDESELDVVACDYQVNGGTMQSVTLHAEQGGYLALLPAQPIGSRITYRLRAADRSTPQNTTVSDEYVLTIENYADRIVDLVPRAESLEWMRKRGATGTFSLTSGQNAENSIVLIGDKSARTCAYVTDVIDLTNFASPELEFCSELSGGNHREPVTARIVASTDGGATFPHLLWRQSAAPDQKELIQESNLTALAGQQNVVIKFLYYADKYWEISNLHVRDSHAGAKPVRNLIVKPGEIVSLHWLPSQTNGVSYRVLAAPSLSDQFVPIATVKDTFYSDPESLKLPQRFYRVEEDSETLYRGTCQPMLSLPFNRISSSFRHRSQ